MQQVLKTNNIILVLLIIFGLNEVYKRVYPQDIITQKDLDRELILQKSQLKNQEYEVQLNKNTIKYETVEKYHNIDSLIVWDADKHTADSIRAIVNPPGL